MCCPAVQASPHRRHGCPAPQVPPAARNAAWRGGSPPRPALPSEPTATSPFLSLHIPDPLRIPQCPPPVSPYISPPPAHRQLARALRSWCAARSPGKCAIRRRCRIGPLSSATARPSRAGPSRVMRASWGCGGAGLGRGELFRTLRSFLSISFVFFRFVSFHPPVTEASGSTVTTLPCRRVKLRASLQRPLCTETLPVPRLRRIPAEHLGAVRRGVPLPCGGGLRPQNPSKGSAPPRRGERAHRRRGEGSRERYFVVIKILPPRRDRICAEAIPQEAGLARWAGECAAAGYSRGLPGSFSRVSTLSRLRRLPALSVPSFPRLPPLRTPRNNPFSGGTGWDGSPCPAHFDRAPVLLVPRRNQFPFPRRDESFPPRRFKPVAINRGGSVSLASSATRRLPPVLRPPDADGGRINALAITRPNGALSLPRAAGAQ